MYDSNKDHSFESDFLGQFNKPKPHNWSPSGAGGSGVEVTDELINNIKGSIKTSEMYDNTKSKFLNALHNVTKYEIKHPEGYDVLLYAFSISSPMYTIIKSYWMSSDPDVNPLYMKVAFDRFNKGNHAHLNQSVEDQEFKGGIFKTSLDNPNRYAFINVDQFIEPVNNHSGDGNLEDFNVIHVDPSTYRFCYTSKHIITLLKNEDVNAYNLAILNRAGFLKTEKYIENTSTGEYADITTDGNYIYLLYNYPASENKNPEIFVYDYDLNKIESDIDLSKYYPQYIFDSGFLEVFGFNFNFNHPVKETIDFYGISPNHDLFLFLSDTGKYHIEQHITGDVLYTADFSKRELDTDMFMSSYTTDYYMDVNNATPMLRIEPVDSSNADPEVIPAPARITTKYAFRNVTIKFRAKNILFKADSMPVLLRDEDPSGRFSGDYISLVLGEPNQNDSDLSYAKMSMEYVNANDGFIIDKQSEEIGNFSEYWANYEIDIYCDQINDTITYIVTIDGSTECELDFKPSAHGTSRNVLREKGVHLSFELADTTKPAYISYLSIESIFDTTCKVANALQHNSVYGKSFINETIVDFNRNNFYRDLVQVIDNANGFNEELITEAICKYLHIARNDFRTIKNITSTAMGNRMYNSDGYHNTCFCPDLVALPYDAPMVPPIEIYMLRATEDNLQRYTEHELLYGLFNVPEDVMPRYEVGNYYANVELGICRFGSNIVPYLRIHDLESKNS